MEKIENVIVTVDKYDPFINIISPKEAKVGDDVDININLPTDINGKMLQRHAARYSY